MSSHIEVIWGNKLLDEGFTSIPNVLIRNYRKLGINHGEWGFICTLLTYKHDERDPFPSQETLAGHLDVSTRQIKKWVESLVGKGLLLVGQRRNKTSKQYGNAVYCFKPLIDAALSLCGSTVTESDIAWDIEYRQPGVPEVPTASVPEVHTDLDLQVHPKIKREKTIENDNKNNSTDVAVVQGKIESQLGTSIKSLLPLLAQWIQKYGEESLVRTAQYIAARREQYKNVIGAYRSAVTQQWDTSVTETRVEVVQASQTQDNRYEAFYKLFPDMRPQAV